MRIRNYGRAGLALAMAGIALAALPPQAAFAETCGDDGTTKLYDPSGAYFDFTDAGATLDRNQPFAALYDGGSNGPADSPPGARSNSDAFDDFGALFVGGTELANMYFSPNGDSCVSEEGGAERVFPVVTINNLQVQRKIYVRPNAQTGGLPGARILNLLTNPTAAPITTTVQVGDLLTTDDNGDLGSDANTAVRSSSSGDALAGAGDKWFVTSDHQNDAGATNSDPALAHVVDGPGGRDAASVIQVGGGTDVDAPQDNVIYRWTITIAPGETAALMSFVVIAEAPAGATQAVQADAKAASIAQSYQTATREALTTGMSATEIAALRNWNDFEVKSSLTAPNKLKLKKSFKTQVTCLDEGCKVTLGGKLKVGTKSFALAPTTVTGAANVATPVKVKLKKKKDLKKIKALIAAKPKLAKKVKLVLTGTASDSTGTATQALSLTSKVKVKKPKKN